MKCDGEPERAERPGEVNGLFVEHEAFEAGSPEPELSSEGKSKPAEYTPLDAAAREGAPEHALYGAADAFSGWLSDKATETDARAGTEAEEPACRFESPVDGQ
ncbi:MAG: hypothetical protein JNG84_06350, partial [Archangium sp.]|nr:hypothetical protein [Archangium sp.]